MSKRQPVREAHRAGLQLPSSSSSSLHRITQLIHCTPLLCLLAKSVFSVTQNTLVLRSSTLYGELYRYLCGCVCVYVGVLREYSCRKRVRMRRSCSIIFVSKSRQQMSINLFLSSEATMTVHRGTTNYKVYKVTKCYRFSRVEVSGTSAKKTTARLPPDPQNDPQGGTAKQGFH